MQIIIVAGGGGTRLWPISNPKAPKQFVPIIDDESLLRKTYNRLIESFKPENIWVNTNRKYLQAAKDCLPENFPEDHFLLEPEKRDNYAAVISAAAVVSHKTSEKEPLIFVPCDDLVSDKKSIENFNSAIEKISKSLEKEEFDLITAGIKPTYPCTNYGYIEISKENKANCFESPVEVISFKEKPDLEKAKVFIQSENYLWNKFNHSFTFKKLKEKLERLDPETLKVVEKFEKVGEIKDSDYAKIPKIAFDYAVLERTDKLGVMGMGIHWEDLGNWEIVEKYIPKLDDNKNHIEFSGSGNKVKTDNLEKKVAFVGVSNVLLVENDEGILVVDSDEAADVKKVAEYFEKK